MAIRDLIPWGRRGRELASTGEEHPVASLWRDMNRLFQDFFEGHEWPLAKEWGKAGAFSPRVDVRETDKEVVVSAEVPGMDEKDIQVELTDDGLTIRGGKETETEEKKEGYVRKETSYGSFRRFIPLPAEVQAAKASAELRKGVLTVTLPKTPEAKAKRKKIEIKGS